MRTWVIANLQQTGTEEHWLLSFSKGGLSALTLLFRHPTLFHYAAAWDVPAYAASVEASVTGEGGWAGSPYGTEANYDDTYDLLTHLAGWASPFTAHPRIWLSGDDSVYEADTAALTAAMDGDAIEHFFLSGHVRTHAWSSGWVPEAIEGLYQVYRAQTPPPAKPTVGTPLTGHPINNSLAFYVVFNEGSGTSVADLHGSIGPATLQAGRTWSTDVYTGDIVLEQTGWSGLVWETSYATLDQVDKSFAVWCRPDILSAFQALVDCENTDGWSFLTDDTGHLQFYPSDGDNTADTGPLGLPLNAWRFVAVTWDASSEEAKFYIEGVLNSTVAIPGASEAASNGNLLFGAIRNNSLFKFDGGWSQVIAWQRVVTANELAALAVNPYLGFEESVQGTHGFFFGA